MRLSLGTGSGGVLPEGDDDVVAEGLELALGVAGLAAAVGVPGVPVGSEVAVAGGGVVQEVPDDDEDGPPHGAAGLLPPASARPDLKGISVHNPAMTRQKF
jgi:1-acyl-sn-glycerol-3-phosphate acyltransferase